MLYLKLFIKKNAIFLLYIVYVIIIIISGYYFDMNVIDEKIKTITSTNIDKEIIITDIKKKEVRFYDTKNPVAASIIFLLIELACIFFK